MLYHIRIFLFIFILGFSKVVLSQTVDVSFKQPLTDVLGDIKQLQINDRYDSKEKIDHILDGFFQMGVTGVRIAIFPQGHTPNQEMYDYTFSQIKRRGFKIFANPAEWLGGRRIANQLEVSKEVGLGEETLGNKIKTFILINHILDFSKQYACDWICPFNEDGAPGADWSVEQFNTIFSQLSGNLNGAKLIGPCTWGIPASIRVLEQTNILQYLDVVTSHNLGFNHDSWSEYINLAQGKPVWDSEVNNYQKYESKSTRIDAALDAGVHGLVLYNSWTGIDFTNGSLHTANQNLLAKYTDTPLSVHQNISYLSEFSVDLDNQNAQLYFKMNQLDVKFSLYNSSGQYLHSHILNKGQSTYSLNSFNSQFYILLLESAQSGVFFTKKLVF